MRTIITLCLLLCATSAISAELIGQVVRIQDGDTFTVAADPEGGHVEVD